MSKQHANFQRALQLSLITIVLLITAVSVARAQNLQPVQSPARVSDGVWRETVPTILKYEPTVNRFYVPPPNFVEIGRTPQVAQITVNYNPVTCDVATNGPTRAWASNEISAFEYAANIWESILITPLSIEIDACWHTGMISTTLGSAGSNGIVRDFTNAPHANTFYSMALANHYRGADINGDAAEINAQFNANFAWYLGIDGNTSTDKTDFVSVVLHEIGHGLGFSGGMRYDDGVGNSECRGTANEGCWADFPTIYDRFTQERQTVSGNFVYVGLLSMANPSSALGTALTSGNVYFDGAAARAANGGQRPELYAPSPWNPGSSYSHLDEGFNNTVNALMTFSFSLGEAIHHPGSVGLGMLQDMGWPLMNGAAVYVDKNNTGEEYGTVNNPFDTVTEGVLAVQHFGTVLIAPGRYNENLTIGRAMTLRVNGNGVVTIGGD